MRYLVDTTWVIEYLRGNQDIIQRMQSFRGDGVAIAIVSLAELYEGVFRSNNAARNETILKDFLTPPRPAGIPIRSTSASPPPLMSATTWLISATRFAGSAAW